MKTVSRMRLLPLFLLTVTTGLCADPAGIVPVGANGQPLNLGFELGTLKDWTAEGTAFAKQPIEGDTVAPRKAGQHSQHAGKFWIGGYENGQGDDLTGTLTSAPFKVTQPWASFLVGGGAFPETHVELATKDDGKVFHIAHGNESENMTRSVVDLSNVQGREIFIRIVDQKKGGWGHVNFDDFLFHAEKPNFPKPASPASALPPDVVEFAGLPAEKAAAVAVVPEGYELKVFASEPDIVNPISFCMDDRARLWVVEGRTYPQRAKEAPGTPAGLGGQDRILVFEDTDGDGKADKRTVFMEGLNLVSGIEVGYGGVFVGAAPYMLFIPVENWDDPKPKGNPEVLLDGWGYQDTHETLNTFHWGPDGWLYGCHGVFTNSEVGAPGTPKDKRVRINAGIWRYQPVTRKFENFAQGTSNPWGIDWNADGDLFCEACVIPHLFHLFDGGRYNRQAGAHFNPYTYDDIKTIADHRHYLGGNPHGGNGRSDAAGGGHAHAGLCIPQHPSWPDSIRGNLLMNNIHGSRINMDIPERKGSGFVAHHGADFINFKDKASQIVDLREGPEGTLFMIDWYDMNQCHSPKREAHDYTTGRIFRLAKKGAKTTPVALGKLKTDDLLAYFRGDDAWMWKIALRLITERKPGKEEASKLLDLAQQAPPAANTKTLFWHRLISLGIALHQVPSGDAASDVQNPPAGMSPANQSRMMSALINEGANSKQLREALETQAKKNPSPIVRLAIAGICQRLSNDERKPIVTALLAHEEDKDDQNLPLMYWYAAEPIVGADPAAAAELLAACKIPKVQEYIARRMAEK